MPAGNEIATDAPFRRLVEITHDLVTIVDDESRMLYVNPAAETIFGLSPEDCQGKLALDFVAERDQHRTRAAFERWVANDPNEPLVFENRQVHRDGSMRDLLWTITRQEIDGRCVLVSVAKDVSLARAAERALAQSEVRLRSLVAGMLDAVLTIDSQGTIQFASDSVQTIFGYDPEEMVGQNIRLIMPEPHRSQHDEYLSRYRETGRTWILNTTREFVALKKSGERFWLEISVARIDVPGQPEPMFCGSVRDISDRKRAERELAESEARFRAIFDSEFQLVGLLRTDGTVVEMNHAAMDSVQAPRYDVIGRPFWETRWWSHCPELQAKCRNWIELAASGEFVREEVNFLGKGDELRTVDFSLKPIFDDTGRVSYLLPEGRDITEVKRAQARETQMLKALATLGESASILAHEIKNPITSINLALRAVANQLGEDDKAVLEDLVGRMQRLEGMIRRTLAFAKPLELECTRVDVLPLLLDPVETLRAEAEANGVELALEVAPDCAGIVVDEGLVHELLTNLVRNALDALEDGGRVHVRAEPKVGTNGRKMIEITVEDSGEGVPESLVTTLFRPFITTKDKGTGLGLALAKKIADAHEGQIDVDSSPELGGARFSLSLPAELDTRG